MKREDVSKIFSDATSEQIDKILDLNSADIGKAKKGYDDLKAELETANQIVAEINRQYEELRYANAFAEDYKAKMVPETALHRFDENYTQEEARALETNVAIYRS